MTKLNYSGSSQLAAHIYRPIQGLDSRPCSLLCSDTHLLPSAPCIHWLLSLYFTFISQSSPHSTPPVSSHFLLLLSAHFFFLGLSCCLTLTFPPFHSHPFPFSSPVLKGKPLWGPLVLMVFLSSPTFSFILIHSTGSTSNCIKEFKVSLISIRIHIQVKPFISTMSLKSYRKKGNCVTCLKLQKKKRIFCFRVASPLIPAGTIITGWI